MEFRAFMEEFYTDMVDFVIRFLGPYYQEIRKQPKTADAHITEMLIKYLYKRLNNKYYKKILAKMQVVFTKAFFQNHYQIIYQIANNFIEVTNKSVSSLLELIDLLVTKFLDDSVTDNDLLKFIVTQINIQQLVDASSDAIDEFCLELMGQPSPEELAPNRITWISQYNNFLFSNEHKLISKRYAFWLNEPGDEDHHIDYTTWEKATSNHFYYTCWMNRKDEALHKANMMGMALYPENEFSYILTPFVLHNLIKNTRELVDKIADIMEKCRFEPRIFNKYDNTDLDTSYMLTAISNDNQMTYDEFLADIKKPMYCPTIIPLNLY